jgi:hypothetical protein
MIIKARPFDGGRFGVEPEILVGSKLFTRNLSSVDRLSRQLHLDLMWSGSRLGSSYPDSDLEAG